MYKIIYSQKSRNQLDVFIASYKGAFTSLFIDSGIQDGELIISNYEKIGDNFYAIVRKKIRERITTNIVLGRKINENNSFSVFIHERSFLIIIDYTEEIETKTRFIENIIFTKK